MFTQVIEEDKLQQNSEDVGTYFLTELMKLRDMYDIVGDVRGKGLMIGMEMVTDKVREIQIQIQILFPYRATSPSERGKSHSTNSILLNIDI